MKGRFAAPLALVALAAALVAIAVGPAAQRTIETVGAGAASAFEPAAAKAVEVADVARRVTDVPRPITRRSPATVRVTLEAREVVATLADGVTYQYWTFDGTVPGPFIRAREGDTVEVTVRNELRSTHLHSIDLHAVKGPGGGKVYTDTAPGKSSTFHFRALRPGLYVYHCASDDVVSHVANGMYGLILVEPAAGLPRVDREFYVMQGEIYTKGPRGQKGHQPYDPDKTIAEEPEYVVFNGRQGALADAGALKARVGETVRIYFANGGPAMVSSFHVIGEIFDRVYDQAALASAPQRNVQTTLVPAGGATMVEFTLAVPGTYLLVDHSLPRAIYRGALGQLVVTGPENPAIFGSEGGAAAAGSGH